MKCPNCSNNMKLNTQLKFNVYKCPVCELYTSEAEFNYSFESNVQLGKRELGIENLRKDNFKLIIENLKNVAESDIHNFQGLEIGSGNGWWLETCKKNNITCKGIEPERVYESFHKKSELDIIYDFYPSDHLKDLKFDFIIFNDVFEHISNINSLVVSVSNNLKANGILIINIPMSNGFFFRCAEFLNYFKIDTFLNRMWQFNFHSPHFTYFNEKNLTSFIKKYPFHIINVINLSTLNYRSLNARIMTDKEFSKTLSFILIPILWLVSPILSYLKPDIKALYFRKK